MAPSPPAPPPGRAQQERPTAPPPPAAEAEAGINAPSTPPPPPTEQQKRGGLPPARPGPSGLLLSGSRGRSGSLGDVPFVPLTRRWTFTGASKESEFLAQVYNHEQQLQQRAAAGGTSGPQPPSVRPHGRSEGSQQQQASPPPPAAAAASASSASTSTTASAASASSPSTTTTPSTPASVPNGTGAATSGRKRDLHKASVAEELVEGATALLLEQQHGGWLDLGVENDGSEAARLQAARKLVRDHFSRLPGRYALNVEGPEVVAIDMRLMAEARAAASDQVTVDVQPSDWDSPLEARSVITISCRDRPNLLDSITRIISRLSSAIVDADIMTSRDGLTLDRFVVEHRDLAEAIEGTRQKLDPTALRRVLETTLNATKDQQEAIASLSPSRLMKKSHSGSQSHSHRGGANGNSTHSSSTQSTTRTPPSSSGDSGEGAGAGKDELIPFAELELIEVVGSGHSGSLWRAKWRGMLVAVKMIKAPELTSEEDQRRHARLLADFERERTIVRGLRHPNLCRLYGVSTCPGSLCLVYDFLEGGSLAGLLRDRSKGYDLFQIALDVAEGMDYLHKRGVMHRDLKPDNLLLNKEGRAVIADFGLVCPTISESDHTGETGTYRYMSSEVIRHEPYSTAADVYSFGIVLNELLTREQPFRGMTPIQAAFAVARQGHRPAIPARTPPKLSQLIQACWHEDPIRRPTFSQIKRALQQIRAEIYGQAQQAQQQQEQEQKPVVAAGEGQEGGER